MCCAVRRACAVLPDVHVHGFHVDTAVLPKLPSDMWSRLIVPGGIATPANSAAFLLAEPHFVQVERFLEMLAAVAPDMAIAGGVVQPGARGAKNSPGALFLGPETLYSGAVGAVLSGPLQVDSCLVDGCRRFGPRATVSQAQGSTIVQLDGQSALVKLRDMFEELPAGKAGMALHLAVDEAGVGAFKTRNIGSFFGGGSLQGSVSVALDAVSPGAVVQLCVRDPDAAAREAADWVQARVGGAGDGAAEAPTGRELDAQSDGSSGNISSCGGSNVSSSNISSSGGGSSGGSKTAGVGAFVYSCVAARHRELEALQDALPHVPVQGVMCQGELFAPGVGRAGGGAMHSYSSVLTLMRRAGSST